MNFEYSARCKDYLQRVRAFMDEHVYPNEKTYHAQLAGFGTDRWQVLPIIEELKAKAKDLVCDVSDTRGAALSADGRYVAFLSGALSLLPESQRGTARLQLYVQDRLTRRLRRVTVDPTGYPASVYPCGASSGANAST